MSMNNAAYRPSHRPLFFTLSNPFNSLKHRYDGVISFTEMQDRANAAK
ncbi:hypothetical protein BJ925_0323 [Rahnella aquatilis]|nr:hypothetical protein BJ925_0323 [Rahnella aquatilis]